MTGLDPCPFCGSDRLRLTYTDCEGYALGDLDDLEPEMAEKVCRARFGESLGEVAEEFFVVCPCGASRSAPADRIPDDWTEVWNPRAQYRGERRRFDERIADLHIVYEPGGRAAERFGPIRVAMPGSVMNITANQAEIAAGLFAGAAAIARRHAENRLLCPPDCPECGTPMEMVWYEWRCPRCRFGMERKGVKG